MAVAARKSGKGKSAPARSRPGLTPALIVGEALAIVDESGLEGLSMRQLAGRLGVEAMALYHHFPSKDALLTAISRALEEEVTARWDNPPADWRERIVAVGAQPDPDHSRASQRRAADDGAFEPGRFGLCHVRGAAEGACGCGAGFEGAAQLVAHAGLTHQRDGRVLCSDHREGWHRPSAAGPQALSADGRRHRHQEQGQG
jgi:AcrR family transcriptional regulator